MRWNRRKPLWPLLIALGCLFALAITAPRSWQPLRPVQAPQAVASARSQQHLAVVTLEPEYNADNAIAPRHAPAGPPALPPLEGSLISVDEYNELSADASLPTLAHPSGIALTQAEQQLPVPSEFDLNALLSMRDSLLTLIQGASNPTSTKDSSTPRVQVTSENDRLAMLDDRDKQSCKQRNNNVDPVTINKVLAAIQVDELLDSIRQSRLALKIGSRLAMRNRPSPQPLVQDSTEERFEQPLLRHPPKVLIDQLEALTTEPSTAQWAEEALVPIGQLFDSSPTPIANPQHLVDELQALAKVGNRQAFELSDINVQHDWQSAALALERRLELWRILLDPSLSNLSIPLADQPSRETMWMPVLGEVASRLAGESNGAAWREYLLLDHVATAASEGAGVDKKGRGKLAQQVLSRMEDSRLTEAQRQFLATEPLMNLQRELRPWAAGSVNFDTLAALMERYEMGREVRYAAAIAQLQQRLRWSTDPRYQNLAEHLEQHYRGANMRIALTDELLNRMIPEQKTVVSPVRDEIAGTKVRGQARTSTHLRVRLLPDPDSWQFGLQAYGVINSKTHSKTGPARVRNAAKMYYQVEKTIVINRQGLSVSPAKAHARGHNELIDVETPLDPIPLLGSLLQNLVRQQHQKARPRAMTEVKSKVVRQAQLRMDHGADPKFSKLEQKFHDRVLVPLEKLALIAEPLEMVTTEQRAVMKLRLAGDGQLAAHTPRPTAPSDSVVSLQLHETVLNNAAAGLGLDGRRVTVGELFDRFATKIQGVGEEPPPDLPVRAVIEFAAHDAIHVGCDGDRLELVLSIRELSYRRDKIKNFQVHAYFRPILHGLDLRLVRDGTLQFAGRRLRTGPRIVLHSVLGKLLRKEHEMSLLGGKLQKDPRFVGLMVTQLVIDDGWIGLALGPAYPERTAWRTPQRSLHTTTVVR